MISLHIASHIDLLLSLRDFHGVLNALKKFDRDRNFFISHAFVQHGVKQGNMEAKVVCLGGEAKYVATQRRHLPAGVAEDYLQFANEVIADLIMKCPCAILDGVVRVDIMKLSTGELVVNEVESLEADTPGKSRNENLTDIHMILAPP